LDSYEQLNFADLNQMGSDPPAAKPHDVNEAQHVLVTPEGHISDERGLMARPIKPHSREKAHYVSRYASTVSVAMACKFEIWWLELFAGPGMLFDRELNQYPKGSPLEALSVPKPFSGYVFADASQECVDSLERRIGPRPGVHIRRGDANDQAHLDEIAEIIPRDALVIAYLDPEGLDLHFNTIRFLSWRYRRLDLLINLPVHQIYRELSRDRGSRSAAAVLPDGAGDLFEFGNVSEALRAHYRRGLRDLGYREDMPGHLIRSHSKNSPLYDLFLASRSPVAAKLYRRATQNAVDGTRGLELGC
jgi:three-Cys-motif partner protein